MLLDQKASIEFLEYVKKKHMRYRRPRLGFEPRHPALSLAFLLSSPQAGRLTATSPRPFVFHSRLPASIILGFISILSSFIELGVDMLCSAKLW